MNRNEINRYDFSGRLSNVLTNLPYETVEDMIAHFARDEDEATCAFLRVPNAGRKTLDEFISKVIAEDPVVARLRYAIKSYADRGTDSVVTDQFVENCIDKIRDEIDHLNGDV